MRIAMVSLPCLVLSLAGCSGNNAPKPTPPPPPTPTAATPTFSVIAGMYTAAQTVTIRDATAGATVYYTTNGTAPTASSTPYTGPVTVSSTETLMAAAIAPGYLLSAVASASYTITPPPPPPAPSGAVLHGQVPVAGAHVYVFSANAAGYGQASISLLNPALTCASDSIGAYVTTGSDGTFAITGDYTCMANTQVYLYALGGDSGSGNNPASGLLAVMGNCPTSGSFSAMTAKIAVNEVSTIAAAYAMAGFATDATHVSSSGTALAQIGITNAFANAASLADLSTGAALAATPAGNGVVPQSEIDTLADILAACVGAVNAGSCSTLFENATSDGTAIGTQPSDTATAAINIAHHPGSNVAALFALSADSSAFAPALATEPNDFTVELVFTVPNEDTDSSPGPGSHPIVIDGDGNVWVVDSMHSNVIKLASSGAFLSPDTGFTGGGLNSPQSIAIDNSGNAWIANYDFLDSTEQPNGTVVEFSNSGTLLSPSNGFGPYAPSYIFSIAIDASGNAWIPYGDGVLGLSSSGVTLVAVANPAGAGGGIGISGTAIDASGNIWGTLPFGSTFFNEFSMSGAIVNPPTAGQFSCGASFLPEQGPSGVAIDASGDVWITSEQGFTKESKSPIPTCSGQGGGIDPAPEGNGGDIAIDGDGNAWVVNGVLAEFSNSGAPLSPSTGYRESLGRPAGIALDGSGNLWATGTNGTLVGNFTSLNVFEYVGASAPVVTPIAAGVKDNALGARP